MNFIKRVLNRFPIVKELLAFFWKEKLWWLIPMISVILILGLLIIFAQSSSVVPFVYVLF